MLDVWGFDCVRRGVRLGGGGGQGSKGMFVLACALRTSAHAVGGWVDGFACASFCVPGWALLMIVVAHVNEGQSANDETTRVKLFLVAPLACGGVAGVCRLLECSWGACFSGTG